MNNINKLDMESEDIVDDNIKKIQELFPDCVTETEDGLKINYEQLKQELSKDIVDDKKERYELTWPGKKEAILEANTPTTKTLRPIRKKSVDFDNTQNIYIEGDNLEALKILQESYLGKVKCIYIDPPYNTGNDFIYKDNFKKDLNEEGQDSGELDEESNKLIANQQSNGRFHSNWLSMMYPRLKLAKNLLTDDGLIFISIDDYEQANLKRICDEIFGKNNFVAQFIRKTGSTRAMAVNFDIRHDYVIIYSKNYSKIKLNEIEKDVNGYINPDNDPNGLWSTQDYSVRTGGFEYNIPSINGRKENIKHWAKSIKDTKILMGGNEKEEFSEIYKRAIYIKEKDWYIVGKFVFKGENGSINKKKYANETSTLKNHTLYDEIGSNKSGSNMLKKLFNIDYEVFSMPKPVELLKYIEFISTDKDSIILDFFAGSSTTAQACFELNAEDNKKRKFIMVQISEKLKEKSQIDFGIDKKITDNAIKLLKSLNQPLDLINISEERIRRASKKIKDETNADIDYGFRVYKIDSSNMKDVYYEPDKLNQNFLDQYESNVKDDRTSEDLLTQIILDLGLTLDLKVEEKQILNNKIYYVGGNSLVACLDKKIDINIIPTICECKPLKVVFKENGFNNDSDKINTFEKIKELSPDTEISVL